MPVWLDSVPEKAVNVLRPNTRRWLLFLVFLMLGGASLTLWNWAEERSGFVFWFTALGLPFCTWGLIFSLRRFAYKAEQIGAGSRNRAREALIESEIRRGQRCAWIVGTYIQHLAGNKPETLLKAMADSIPTTELSIARGHVLPVRYAALSDFQTNLDAALIAVVSKSVARVQNIIEALPQDISCWLMLDCDTDISAHVEEQYKEALSAKTGRVFKFMSSKGLPAFDAWLDKHWENPGILVVVTLALPATPQEGDADAVTVLVLCNRKAADYPDAVCLHRPEKGTEIRLGKTLSRALQWAAIKPDALKAGWSSGPLLAQGSSWNKACEENRLTFSLAEDNRCIDPILGYTGRAATWLAIILADTAYEEYGPQIIAAQPAVDDDIWVMAITRKDARKETQKNG